MSLKKLHDLPEESALVTGSSASVAPRPRKNVKLEKTKGGERSGEIIK